MIMEKSVSNAIARQFGLESYSRIMKLSRDKNIDLSVDVDGFQKLFNAYYRVRRNEEWRKEFYKYFETEKNATDISFDTIIDELHKNTGRVEASFASKMLATINPDMPILDSQVLTNLSLEIKGTGDKKRENAKNVYTEIVRRYDDYKKTANCKKAIALFDELFPAYTELTPVKKIDWFLWSMQPNELKTMGFFEELIAE